jgi:hypothetical protein
VNFVQRFKENIVIHKARLWENGGGGKRSRLLVVGIHFLVEWLQELRCEVLELFQFIES